GSGERHGGHRTHASPRRRLTGVMGLANSLAFVCASSCCRSICWLGVSGASGGGSGDASSVGRGAATGAVQEEEVLGDGEGEGEGEQCTCNAAASRRFGESS